MTDRQLFSSILTMIQPAIMNTVLATNNILLSMVGLDSTSPTYLAEIEEKVPLWTLSGGEAINLYSDQKTDTKDLDFKLLLFGDWSISNSYFKGDSPQRPGIINSHFYQLRYQSDWDNKFMIPYDINGQPTLGYFPCNTEIWARDGQNIINTKDIVVNLLKDSWNIAQSQNVEDKHKTNFFHTWNILIESRINIITGVLVRFDDCKKQLMFINNPLPESLNTFTDHLFTNGWNAIYQVALTSNNILPDGRIPIRLGLPYLLGREISTSFPFYPANADANYTNPELLFEIKPDLAGFINMKRLAKSLDDWCLLSLEQKMYISRNHLKIDELLEIKSYLRSLMSTILYVSHNPDIASPGDWTITLAHEGVLDLFIDPSAGHNPRGKKTYEGKKNDGNMPGIIHAISYCDPATGQNSSAPLRIPTVMWLIRDQTRMLFHALKGQDTPFKGWGEQTFITAPSNIDPNKYFNKVKGLLSGMYKAIDFLDVNFKNNTTSQEVINLVEGYRSPNCVDVYSCGPDAFLSDIISRTNREYWSRLYTQCIASSGGKHIKNKIHIKKRKTNKLKQKKRRSHKL